MEVLSIKNVPYNLHDGSWLVSEVALNLAHLQIGRNACGWRNRLYFEHALAFFNVFFCG